MVGFVLLFIFNLFLNVSGILHPEYFVFGWRWIAFQLLHLFSLFVILTPYCGGRKCYVCNVNLYNKTVSAGVISKRLLLGSGSDEAPIQNDLLIWWRVFHSPTDAHHNIEV